MNEFPEQELMLGMKLMGESDYAIGKAVTACIYRDATPESLAVIRQTIANLIAAEGMDEFTRGSLAWLDENHPAQ